ncbi:hypothetical protein M9Y10_031169 [Tritrichomonas musculus]|uniref:Surface antigen BspA-like n=1 Tax=Tritrichomonas musculus TaxID=1915356 RepID=A0ABR2H1Y9_9EUKA
MSNNQPQKKVTLENFYYSINEEDQTASVIKCRIDATEIIIPRSIKHELKEYIVTIISVEAFIFSGAKSVSFEPNSELRTIEKDAFKYSKLESIRIPSSVTKICEGAFSHCRQLSRVEFEPSSELRTIEKDAFSNTKVASIRIPASVVDLKDGWFFGTKKLCQVEVEPGNAQYSSVGGKCITCKSDISQEEYDTLAFWTSNSIEANIPSTIKIIGSYAFSESKLESIIIPSHVTQICDHAFYKCRKLSRVEFETNSELRTIEIHAFSYSKLESIIIPSHVTQICDHAFYECIQLSLVEFEPNSELQTIGEYAFFKSKVTSIKIPASVVDLKDGWFIGIKCLCHVEVEPGNARYSSVDGKCIIYKSNSSQEDYDTLIVCAKDSIEANIQSTIKIIGTYSFSFSKLVGIVIPSHVTQICESAFFYCNQLSRVEFEPNSELQTIGEYAFSYSKLEIIIIPSHVTQICESAFSSCEQLSRVEFEPNSELQIIENRAFSYSNLTSILIPSHITKICEGAFSSCEQLQIVEIEENSVFESIDMRIFGECKIVMFPAQKKNL